MCAVSLPFSVSSCAPVPGARPPAPVVASSARAPVRLCQLAPPPSSVPAAAASDPLRAGAAACAPATSPTKASSTKPTGRLPPRERVPVRGATPPTRAGARRRRAASVSMTTTEGGSRSVPPRARSPGWVRACAGGAGRVRPPSWPLFPRTSLSCRAPASSPPWTCRVLEVHLPRLAHAAGPPPGWLGPGGSLPGCRANCNLRPPSPAPPVCRTGTGTGTGTGTLGFRLGRGVRSVIDGQDAQGGA